MAERKEEEELNSRIISFFEESSAEGWIMLTIPEVADGLKVDRRKIETPLALMSKGKNPQPKLVELKKARVKYYILKDVSDFCQKWKAGAK